MVVNCKVERVADTSLPTREQIFELICSKSKVTACIVAFERGTATVRNCLKVYFRIGYKEESGKAAKGDKVNNRLISDWIGSISTNQIEFFRARNETGLIRRISSFDMDCLHKGVDLMSLSYAWQVHNIFLKSVNLGDKFDAANPFVLNHVNKINQLQNCFDQFQTGLIVLEPLRKVTNVNAYASVPWHVEFLKAWNSLLDSYLKGIWHKLPQIFVYGPPNVGKTHFVSTLIGSFIQNMQVFQPYVDPSKGYTEYQWSGFDEKKHSIVFDDEFMMKNFNSEIWKKAVEGKY